jgi:hypothetical protein
MGLRRLAADFAEHIELVGGRTQAETVGVDMLRCRKPRSAGGYALELARAYRIDRRKQARVVRPVCRFRGLDVFDGDTEIPVVGQG